MLVDALVRRWTAAGHTVVDHRDPRRPPRGRVAFLHVNTTHVPPAYLAAAAGYPIAINGRAPSIDRAVFCNGLVEPDDNWDGPVIVKTRCNYGGVPERRLQRRTFAGRWRLRWRWCFRRGWRHRRYLRPEAYPVLPDKATVPAGVWANPHLLVQRFVPEREGPVHFVRAWVFFGSRSISVRYGSADPIVKFGNRITDFIEAPVPGELEALRQRVGLDYGRFDYALHAGRPVVFDINKTMGPPKSDAEADADVIDYLAGGLNDYLPVAGEPRVEGGVA